jgi:hypothetical protein
MRTPPILLLVLGALLAGCASAPGPVDSGQPPFAVLTLKVAG